MSSGSSSVAEIPSTAAKGKRSGEPSTAPPPMNSSTSPNGSSQARVRARAQRALNTG